MRQYAEGEREGMNKLLEYFTKRNTFKVVVIELIVVGLLLCVLLMTAVEVEIRLKGETDMTIVAGTAFVDPGAAAYADGAKIDVTVSGEVNTQVPGTYTLCYEARYLLSSEKTYRTVTVVASGVSVAD